MNRQELLAKAAGLGFKTETVTIEGLGDITLRQMSGQQQAEVIRMLKTDESRALIYAAAVSIVDDSGSLMFSLTDKADLALLGSWPASVLSSIFNATKPLNKFDAEEAAKN